MGKNWDYKPEDYVAYDGDVSIGRIYKITSIQSGGWFWTMNGTYRNRNGSYSGHVADRDAACDRVERAWDTDDYTGRGPFQNVLSRTVGMRDGPPSNPKALPLALCALLTSTLRFRKRYARRISGRVRPCLAGPSADGHLLPRPRHSVTGEPGVGSRQPRN